MWFLHAQYIFRYLAHGQGHPAQLTLQMRIVFYNARQNCHVFIQMRSEIVRMPPEMKRLIVSRRFAHGFANPFETHGLERLKRWPPWTQESRLRHPDNVVFGIQGGCYASIAAEFEIGISQPSGSGDCPVSSSDQRVRFSTAICNQPLLGANTYMLSRYLVAREYNAS